MDTRDTQQTGRTQGTPDAPDTPEDPAVVAARIRRRLFMGAALFLALASIYAGLLGAPQAIEVGLAAGAVVCVIAALRAPSR
jgi:hypothetical protein